jgi:glycosyltransferase involved in cell wall biosynthesis
MRGGERVLEILADGFPDADIYTLIHNEGAVTERINRHTVHTSWLQNQANIMERYRYYLPAMPATIKRFKPADIDLMISTSHCVAKSIPTPATTKHLCYCFTPMRYAWLFREEYFGRNLLKHAVLGPVLAGLRSWDAKTANRVDHFVAISKHVQERIKTFYGRESDVVYPPADTDYFTPNGRDHAGYDFIVSALVPYKKIDLAVRAYNKLGYPLKIMGVGTELNELKALAKDNISFLGRQPDEALRELLQGCRCFVFPGEEDFGITPVEAMACGRPVVAYGRGGVTETVVNGECGVFFDVQEVDALVAAVEQCGNIPWDTQYIRQRAEVFSIPNFVEGMNQSIARCMS